MDYGAPRLTTGFQLPAADSIEATAAVVPGMGTDPVGVGGTTMETTETTPTGWTTAPPQSGQPWNAATYCRTMTVMTSSAPAADGDERAVPALVVAYHCLKEDSAPRGISGPAAGRESTRRPAVPPRFGHGAAVLAGRHGG